LPVPTTVGEQDDVPFVKIELGAQTTVTEVMVMGMATATIAEAVFAGSSREVAVMMEFPVLVAVKTPVELMVPPVADQVTAGLNAPVP
jgi:hypothetical protein